MERGAARLGADPVLEQREAALDDRVELREAEHVDAGGGELDREWQPVHLARDVRRERDGVRVSWKFGRAARARATNSCTAGESATSPEPESPTGSGSTPTRTSPTR